MDTKLKIGSRVRLKLDVEYYPTGIYQVGTSGTLVRVDENDVYCIKLDEHHPELAEWDNELQIYGDELYYYGDDVGDVSEVLEVIE